MRWENLSGRVEWLNSTTKKSIAWQYGFVCQATLRKSHFCHSLELNFPFNPRFQPSWYAFFWHFIMTDKLRSFPLGKLHLLRNVLWPSQSHRNGDGEEHHKLRLFSFPLKARLWSAPDQASSALSKVSFVNLQERTFRIQFRKSVSTHQC